MTRMMQSRVVILLFMTILGAGIAAQEAVIVEVENIVQSSQAGAGVWERARTNQALSVRDRVRTRQRSRATVRLTDLYTMRLEQFTTIEITPGLVSGDRSQLNMLDGAAFIFSRESNAEVDITTPAANGALRGTQLFVRVSPDGTTFFQVQEGQVEMSNAQGRLTLKAGEAADARPGQAPRRTAVLEARNILQWALYYPAVLDPGSSSLSENEAKDVAESLAAYRSGDLLAAVERYPAGYRAQSDGAKLFEAGVLLAVGRLDEAGRLLEGVVSDVSGKKALLRLIAAVQFQAQEEWETAHLGSSEEALAQSYYLQSRSRLEEAREAARRAVELAPQNGFAWTRLAELEFSFGRLGRTAEALERALELTPRNAQAHALQGFVLSGQNRVLAARSAFETAVGLDGALGNGWLGLGLTKIKRGERQAGRRDLQTAATVEPLSSIFHSYLGKALSNEGLEVEAEKDHMLAKALDPNDPTPWLYSGIAKAQGNRMNEAIAEVEQSIRLNENRRVYRSQFLLDQDRAVRSANLAKFYQNAGMDQVAVREATRAVESDYTNASAHLFLSNAFDSLRDPKRIELRYETPWFNELLLANLLSPVGGGPLSQFVSQQEYSKLLEADGLGGSLTQEWRNTEERKATEWRSTTSVFGTYGNISFGLDAYFLEDDGGIRPNSAIDRKEIYGQLKWQASPNDIFYFLGKWQEHTAGDNFSTYDDQPLAPGLAFEETQEPGLLLGAWNHQWAPGIHTLFLAGRLAAHQRLSDPQTNQLLVRRDALAFSPGFTRVTPDGFEEYARPDLQRAAQRDWDRQALGLPPDRSAPVRVDLLDGETVYYSRAFREAIAPYLGTGEILEVSGAPFRFETLREFEIYTAEIQQIFDTRYHTFLAGGRWQSGEFITHAELSLVRPSLAGAFTTPAVSQRSVVDFDRVGLYAYEYLKPAPWLTLIGGVSWDEIDRPDNFRNPPVNDSQRSVERVSGKAGFVLAPSPWLTLRGAYTEGMGGVTFDESVRLEPVQVAGFNQAYRTVISESIAGSVETPLYKTWGLQLEGQLPTRTWWSAAVSAIEEDVDRTLGAFDGYDLALLPISPIYFPASTRQELDYREESFVATLNQLVSRQFSLGATYQVTRSELTTNFSDLPPLLVPGAKWTDEATLHQLVLSATWNSPTGFFARLEAAWYAQQLMDDPVRQPPGSLPRPDEDFWQYSAMVGYRFHRNLCEISAGLLNINGQNYQLSPLNPHRELERDQTVVLRCRLSF